MATELSSQQQAELTNLLQTFGSVFSNIPGRTDQASIKIETGDAPHVRLPLHRLPHSQHKTVQTEIRELLEAGLIEPSHSAWASPIVLVPKKDKTFRLCVDYCRLNSITVPNPYPMPRIDDVLDRLGQAQFISTLDLTKGYWQVPVEKSSRPKTAFVTPLGKYQFTVMPFGLVGAPATFQWL